SPTRRSSELNDTSGVTWSSSNTNVATIASAQGMQGVATGVSQGQTTITAAFGAISGSATLTVAAPVLASLAVSPTNPSVAAGVTQPFQAIATFSDGSMANDTSGVVWSSSKTNVATISHPQGPPGVGTRSGERQVRKRA